MSHTRVGNHPLPRRVLIPYNAQMRGVNLR
jgi:hypothetical protein